MSCSNEDCNWRLRIHHIHISLLLDIITLTWQVLRLVNVYQSILYLDIVMLALLQNYVITFN